jgi:hypothetical protein
MTSLRVFERRSEYIRFHVIGECLSNLCNQVSENENNIRKYEILLNFWNEIPQQEKKHFIKK